MLARDLYSSSHLTKKQREIRDLVLNDLEAFIKLVSPHMDIADCHRDMIKFLTNEEASTHQLILYPRYHSKSTIIGYYCGWRIVRDPLITILYASATATLAEAAVGLIKNIIDNDAIRKYFPELLGREEGKRELWRQDRIAVDHPIRKELKIRDATIFATGAGKNITGLHFDMIILDDIVAPTTELDPLSSVGRENARRWVSFATSILAPDGEIKVVGTRYHSEDIYNSFITMAEPIFDDDGNIVGEEPIYEVLERKVE